MVITSRTKVVVRLNNVPDMEAGFIVEGEDFEIALSNSKEEDWRVYVSDSGTGGQRSIDPQLTKTDRKPTYAEIEVCVLDSEYRPIDRINIGREGVDRYGAGPEGWLKYSTLMAHKDRYLPNNCLTFSFDVSVVKGFDEKKCDFINSFNVKELNDCRFDVRGKQFFASKAILSDRCEAFHTMFTTEKADNVVVIDDIQPHVFEEFLRFLYFKFSDKLEEMAEDMRYVAHKYMLSKLKNRCESLYYLRIDTRNAFQVLEVMNKWDNKSKIEKTLDYIKDNWNEVLETEWKRLVAIDSHPIAKLIANLKPKGGYKPLKESQTMSYTYWVAD